MFDLYFPVDIEAVKVSSKIGKMLKKAGPRSGFRFVQNLAGPFSYQTDRVFFQGLGKKNKKQKFVTWNPGDTMGVSGHGSFFCLWTVHASSARASVLTEPWATPPTAGAMKIERGGGACLHLSSRLCLASRPSCSVCRISQRLSLSFSSCLHPEPRPLLFIMPQPFVAPLSFGWLSRCPALQPPSCHNSAWCLGLHLLLIPCP